MLIKHFRRTESSNLYIALSRVTRLSLVQKLQLGFCPVYMYHTVNLSVRDKKKKKKQQTVVTEIESSVTCKVLLVHRCHSLVPRCSEGRGGGEKKSAWYLLHAHALNVRLFYCKISRLCFDNVVAVILDHTLVITSSVSTCVAMEHSLCKLCCQNHVSKNMVSLFSTQMDRRDAGWQTRGFVERD